MDLRFSPDDEAFRLTVREWLEAQLTGEFRALRGVGGPGRDHELHDQRLAWERALGAAGWIGLGWPEGAGGRGATLVQQVIFHEEYARARAPGRAGHIGEYLLGPTIAALGTDEQKRRFLPPIARGVELWCQGYSEPNAGSDLASLKTSARDEGDHFVVNGTKIWTSYGDKSDWMYALVRTDASAPKHLGISLIVLDMRSPGISVSPIDLISGKSAFCQVFFDNVKVPKSQLIGPLNGGWTLGKSLLQHERKAMSKFGETSLPNHFHLLPLLERYLPEPRSAADQALYARALACAMDEHAYALTVQRMGEEARSGQDISGLMAIMKLVHSEQDREKFEILLDALGYHALGWEGDAFTSEELAITRSWLNGFALTIAGGASEVQLNVIAKRVLGLPDAK